jgi:hypothetical protein
MRIEKGRPRRAALLVSYAAVMLFQVLWHWSLAFDWGVSRALLRFYVTRPRHGPIPSQLLDVALPATIAGFLLGWISWRRPLRQLWPYILLFGFGIVVAMPFYGIVVDKTLLWWLPQSSSAADATFFATMVIVAVWACINVTVLAGIGHDLGQKRHTGGPSAPEAK